VIDDMEVVTDWASSDITNTPIALESTVVKVGSGSLKINITDGASLNDTITKTFTAEDWSSSTSLRFWINQTNDLDKIRMRVRVSDGTNSKTSGEILIINKDTWVEETVLFNSFTEDGGGTTDMTAITSVVFVVSRDQNDEIVYIDHLRRVGDPGTFDLELYDFGTTAVPTALSQGTLKTWTDGHATHTLNASSTKDLIILQEIITGLTVNNYYGIRVFNKTSVGDLDLFGESSGNYYASGRALKSTDNGTTLSNITTGNEDFYFHVYSKLEAYISHIQVVVDKDPDGSNFNLLIEDSVEKVKSVIINNASILGQLVKDMPVDIPKKVLTTDTLEMYYNDVASTAVTKVGMNVHAYLKPHTPNG